MPPQNMLIDEVQHPVLGPLRFPKDMPFTERNALIQEALKAHTAEHAPSSAPAAQPGAFQTTKGGAVFNANKSNEETGGQLLHRLLLTGANKVGSRIDRSDAEDLVSANKGNPQPAIVWGTYGPRMLRSILQTGADMTTPKGAALTAGVALANTNPVTAIPVDSAIATHGGYGVYKHRQALADFATTGQANPNELEAGLNAGAELTGGLAGAGAHIKGVATVPIEQQNAAAQKALDPGWGKREALQHDLAAARPYLGGRGVENVSDVQNLLPGAKSEIWRPAAKGFEEFGEEPVQGPDGPTTYNKLEARRRELSAQLQGIQDRDPATLHTILQQGKNPAALADEQSAVESLLDERMRQAGVNFPVVRRTIGGVKGIERQVSGTNTVSETPQRYGLGRAAQDLSINPVKTVRGAVQGARDILQGRPIWSGKPTDVGIAEGLKSGASKPSFATTTSPKPIGPEFRPPAPTPAPVEQLPATGPGNVAALFPDIPSSQAPSVAHAGGEVPNWPPKTPDWSPPNIAPPIPDAESTIPPTTPYGPPNMQGPPPLPPGITQAQWDALPASMRKFGNIPKPGSYSRGGEAEVTPQGAPLPSAGLASSPPPTLPSISEPQGAYTPGPPEDAMEAARRGAPGINPTLRSLHRQFLLRPQKFE